MGDPHVSAVVVGGVLEVQETYDILALSMLAKIDL